MPRAGLDADRRAVPATPESGPPMQRQDPARLGPLHGANVCPRMPHPAVKKHTKKGKRKSTHKSHAAIHHHASHPTFHAPVLNKDRHKTVKRRKKAKAQPRKHKAAPKHPSTAAKPHPCWACGRPETRDPTAWW